MAGPSLHPGHPRRRPPRLKITNTGPVIPADQVIQPFQRLPSTRPAADEGLGLSIVVAIAKAHHATLTINRGPRGGLDVGISFPTATGGAAAMHAVLATA